MTARTVFKTHFPLILPSAYIILYLDIDISNHVFIFQLIFKSCRFLNGAESIDDHFHSTPFEKNIPVSGYFKSMLPRVKLLITGAFILIDQVLLGLLSVWNVSFLEYPARVSDCTFLVVFSPCINIFFIEFKFCYWLL